jgi:hypothetical protein
MLLSKLVFCDELFIGSVIRYFGYFPMALWVIIANFMASSVKFLMDFGYHTCSIFWHQHIKPKRLYISFVSITNKFIAFKKINFNTTSVGEFNNIILTINNLVFATTSTSIYNTYTTTSTTYSLRHKHWPSRAMAGSWITNSPILSDACEQRPERRWLGEEGISQLPLLQLPRLHRLHERKGLHALHRNQKQKYKLAKQNQSAEVRLRTCPQGRRGSCN